MNIFRIMFLKEENCSHRCSVKETRKNRGASCTAPPLPSPIKGAAESRARDNAEIVGLRPEREGQRSKETGL